MQRSEIRATASWNKKSPANPCRPSCPLALYHGQKRWKTPEAFHALFGELDETLAPYVPAFRHALST
jgi:hypothetical protein